jgi:hypothetical protein
MHRCLRLRPIVMIPLRLLFGVTSFDPEFTSQQPVSLLVLEHRRVGKRFSLPTICRDLRFRSAWANDKAVCPPYQACCRLINWLAIIPLFGKISSSFVLFQNWAHLLPTCIKFGLIIKHSRIFCDVHNSTCVGRHILDQSTCLLYFVNRFDV